MMNSLSGNLLAFSQQNRAKFMVPSLSLDWFFPSRIMLILDRKSSLVNKKIGLLSTPAGHRRPDKTTTDWKGKVGFLRG
jgi:hypothetical protein